MILFVHVNAKWNYETLQNSLCCVNELTVIQQRDAEIEMLLLLEKGTK